MRLERVKKQAKFYFILALAAAALFAVQEAGSLIAAAQTDAPFPFSLRALPLALFVVLVLIHASRLLRSVAREDSPFHEKNIRHLQWIGWLFVVYEPLAWVVQQLSNRFFPIPLADGTFMTVTSSYGGVFLVSGLVVLAVANIFRYGVELQQLSDETL